MSPVKVSVLYKSPLAIAISSLLAQAAHLAPAFAQDRSTLEEIVVTATRRAESLRDVPLNIAALTGAVIEERGISNLAEIGRSVPGLYVEDRGGRLNGEIIVRGLSVNPVGAGGVGNSGGGTVATYVGEIPLYVDLRLDDIERVEVLLGPQGTLYGAGTLGGAIRYIPNRPQFEETTVSVRGDAFSLAHSDGVGGEAGATLNVPLGDMFALRASVDYLDEPGFLDYGFVVREPGVSDPQPDFTDPDAVAANLRREKDANSQQALSGRIALRGHLTDRIDANLTYYYQDQQVDGAASNDREAIDTGVNESAARFLEPVERRNELLALEVTADLGFAELTTATSASDFSQDSLGDLTDLLISLEYGYELFPSFVGFQVDERDEESLNLELRLVSKSDGPWKWIAGAFYNENDNHLFYREFTPGYSEFLVNVLLGGQGNVRPDALEFIADLDQSLRESALYGEIGYDFTDKWQVTLGGRYYDYKITTVTGFDLPLLNTAFGAPPDAINLSFTSSGQSESGSLFKFNTSYDFNEVLMGYLTVSEGYRIGDANPLTPCSPGGPPVCALPDEEQYFPDSTTNYEIGVRSQWFDQSLTLDVSMYFVDWQDPQLSGVSQNGQVNIVVNGEGAESRGFELSFDARLTERFAVRGSYGYTQAELTDDAPGLVGTIPTPPAVPPQTPFTPLRVDGRAGDRLPGSPEWQGTLFASYELPLASSLSLGLNYGVTAIGDVLTRVGGRGDGETLGGFALHSASAVLRADRWSVALYAENLFDKRAVTSVTANRNYVQSVANIDGDPVALRAYSKNVVRPRQLGLRFTYDFAL